MAYEISKELTYAKTTIETPLSKTAIPLIQQQPVIIAILRAAIPYFQGIVNFLDQADSGFVGAFRKEEEEDALLEIKLDYIAIPPIENREVIIVDPMLATGRSFVKCITELLKHGTPSFIHLSSVIAAPEGVEFIEKNINIPYKIWTCALDNMLDQRFYIVPGLGDAGDLSFGPKL